MHELPKMDPPLWERNGDTYTTTIEWLRITVCIFDVRGYHLTGRWEIYNLLGTFVHAGRAWHKQLGPLRERRVCEAPRRDNVLRANKNAAIAYACGLLGYRTVHDMSWES